MCIWSIEDGEQDKQTEQQPTYIRMSQSWQMNVALNPLDLSSAGFVKSSSTPAGKEIITWTAATLFCCSVCTACSAHGPSIIIRVPVTDVQKDELVPSVPAWVVLPNPAL